MNHRHAMSWLWLFKSEAFCNKAKSSWCLDYLSMLLLAMEKECDTFDDVITIL